MLVRKLFIASALILSVSPAALAGNTATVVQLGGLYNKSNISQVGTGVNRATTAQFGAINRANTQQIGFANISSTGQVGVINNATTGQRGVLNASGIVQFGSVNNANVGQFGLFGSVSSVWQNGVLLP